MLFIKAQVKHMKTLKFVVLIRLDGILCLNYKRVRFALTSLGPMVLEVGFSGATTEDIRPTGTLSPWRAAQASGCWWLYRWKEGRKVQLKNFEHRARKKKT